VLLSGCGLRGLKGTISGRHGIEIRFARKWFCKELSHFSELKSEQNGSLDAWDPSVPSDGRM